MLWRVWKRCEEIKMNEKCDYPGCMHDSTYVSESGVRTCPRHRARLILMTKTTKTVKEGWGKPLLANTRHYFVDSRSLCGSWGVYHGRLEQGGDDSPNNCKECARRLKGRRAGQWFKEKRNHDP